MSDEAAPEMTTAEWICNLANSQEKEITRLRDERDDFLGICNKQVEIIEEQRCNIKALEEELTDARAEIIRMQSEMMEE